MLAALQIRPIASCHMRSQTGCATGVCATVCATVRPRGRACQDLTRKPSPRPRCGSYSTSVGLPDELVQLELHPDVQPRIEEPLGEVARQNAAELRS
jgi:hypothetical protein